jgi:RNA polymerase sigma-70 factor, ECF subfamily
VSAILEEMITTADIGNEAAIPPTSRNSGEDLSAVPTTFAEVEGLFNRDALTDSGTITTEQSSSVNLGLGYSPHAENPSKGRNTAWSVRTGRSGRTESPRDFQPIGVERNGDFDNLYHTHQRRVYRQCFRMLGNQADAEDLTQEVFLQLYRKADTFRGEASFSTWLYRLTVNTVLMQLRRHRRWQAPVTSLDAAPDAGESVTDVLGAASELQASSTSTIDSVILGSAIAQLPAGYKAIFLLHDQEGYRHDEIAKMLGISEGTSKSQLHKARLRLRLLLGPGGDGMACFRPAPAA